MHTEQFSLHDCGEGKAVKESTKQPSDMSRRLGYAFIVERVDLVHGSRFMVAPQKEESMVVLDTVEHQKEKGFHGLGAPVDVVAQEEIADIAWEAKGFKHFDESLQMSVNGA